MTTWTKSLAAITLFVDDLPAVRQFYLDVFELPDHFEDANSIVFKFGDTLVNLLSSRAAPALLAPGQPGDPARGPTFVLTIEVPDVDAVAAQWSKTARCCSTDRSTDRGACAPRAFATQRDTCGRSRHRHYLRRNRHCRKVEPDLGPVDEDTPLGPAVPSDGLAAATRPLPER
jgi:catechol 2,3-dioxygenase-like lactoylglutathione lyase family enzyme